MKASFREVIHNSHKMPEGDDYKLRNSKLARCRYCGAGINTNPGSINERCGSSWTYDSRLKFPCTSVKGQP